MRLRQIALVAHDLTAARAEITAVLGLDYAYDDPGVGKYGLRNAVFPVGATFLEVVSPKAPGTTAARLLEKRGGDGGYMVIFDLEDLEGARSRALERGVRVVWQIDLPDISGTHLHPADMRGAIVSLDQSRPYGTWRWGGPEWTGRTGAGAPGRLAGITLAVADPAATAARWGEVLGAQVSAGDDGESLLLCVQGGEVRFAAAASEREEGLVEIALELPQELPGGAEAIELGGVTLRRV